MPVVNIPIKILGQSHSHSRSNSSSSVDNDRDRQAPPQQPSQPAPTHQQAQQAPNSNMNNSGFPSSFSSRSPIPDFPGFSSSAFNDPEWSNFPQFPNFPSNFGDRSSFFGRDGGLSPNPGAFRGSPSPTGTMRRNSAQRERDVPVYHHQQPPAQPRASPRASPAPQAPQAHQAQAQAPLSRPASRPASRTREPKEVEVPERPAVIPLPYEPKKGSTIEENIAKITIGKNDLCPDETDGDPSPLTSPITEGKVANKKSKKLQRNQSVVDFNAKTIVALDKIEIQVEQLRKKAAEMEMEKEQILRALGDISVHNCMFKLEECDREEIEAITERLTKRTKTVQVVVETPRNEEQKKALEDASHMIDEVTVLMKSNIEKAKVCLQTYMNACSYEETAGATCQNFLKIIIQCAADDQKRIKRRLEALMSQIEAAEKTKADLMDDESE